MTREEAIKAISDMILDMEYPNGVYHEKFTEDESQKHLALYAVKKALRPVSREQVERLWPGCEACKDAGLAIGEVQFYGPFEGPIDVSGNMHYCPNCGRPITPVAKDRQGKRLETLKDEKSDL